MTDRKTYCEFISIYYSQLDTVVHMIMKTITIIGDIFCDIVASLNSNSLPTWGTDTLAPINIIPGGSCLNTTLHGNNYSLAKNNNIKFRIFSSVGNDSQGTICTSVFDSKINPNDSKNYVIEKNIMTINEYRTGSCIVLSGQLDRSFISDRGTNSIMSIDMFDHNRLIDTNHIHIAGYYNCDTLIRELPDLLKKVRERCTYRNLL